MNDKRIIRGAQVYTGGELQKVDIRIVNHTIEQLCKQQEYSSEWGIIDAEGLTAIPSLADVHVHLREPGFEYKETVGTGTEAARAGGFGVVCPMPNVNPVPDSLANLSVLQQIIARDAVVDVRPFASITRGRRGCGELVDFAALAPYVAGFSDDGCGIQPTEVMEQAMRRVKEADSIIAAHCEVDSLVRGGYIHSGQYALLHNHRGICSESEWGEVKRDIELVRLTGCRFHVCHVSTKESVELVRRAKAEGLPVTCETAPHYLTLCQDDLQEHGRFKMNPPLRNADDRDALIEGIKDGTIEVIATDHAPHSAEEKSRGLEKSAMGIVGLETSLPVVYTRLVESGIITFKEMIELMCINPRRIFRLGGGSIEAGQRADIALFDLNGEYVIDPTQFRSKGHSTPFKGWRVKGRCKMLIR